MENKILELINEKDYKRMTINEFAPILNANDSESFKQLVKTIVKLEDNLILCRDKNNRYDLIERFGFKPGIIQINKKGYGFVTLLNEESSDIFIPKPHINGAYNQDTVLIKVSKESNGQSPEGEVIKIIERGTNEIIGIYYEEKDTAYIQSEDKRFKANIIVKQHNTRGAMPNHVVKVEIINYISEHLVEGKIVEILGHKNDPGIDILSVVHKLNIPSKFT